MEKVNEKQNLGYKVKTSVFGFIFSLAILTIAIVCSCLVKDKIWLVLTAPAILFGITTGIWYIRYFMLPNVLVKYDNN